MLLQLRVTVPPDRTAAVRDVFTGCPGLASLVVLPGASVSPPGDVLLADVARESADGLIDDLRQLGVDRDGGVAVQPVDVVSRRAEEAEERAPGEASDAVVWEQVIRETAADSRLSVSFLAFLTIATMLAAIAILIDSAILTVGAMVLGPEFGPLAALAVALVHRRRATGRTAAVTLVVGFVVAITLTALSALVGRGLGWFTAADLSHRTNTGFITAPDKWSVLVAVLAGIAGVLSLTSARSGALVGVFISVTTVPAAGAMALGLALARPTAFLEAAAQLGINLLGILVAATATLTLQRTLWRRVPRTTPAMAAATRPGPRS